MLHRVSDGRVGVVIVRSLLWAGIGCHDTDPFEPNYQPVPIFSNPTSITNPFLTLSSLAQDVLDGSEGGAPHRVVRTRLSETRTFDFNGAGVATAVVVDSAFENGA